MKPVQHIYMNYIIAHELGAMVIMTVLGGSLCVCLYKL